jgi:hypothetical protein
MNFLEGEQTGGDFVWPEGRFKTGIAGAAKIWRESFSAK